MRVAGAKALKQKDKYHHGDLRKALVEASLEIIGREGAEALSLRNAARTAGVSHAAPYAHFDDKEDLIAAVKDEGFKELYALLEHGLARLGPDPVDRLRGLALIYLDFARTQRAKYQIMFRRPLAKDPKPESTYIGTGRAIFALLAQEVRHLHAHRGRSRTFSPELHVMTSWSTLHGLCSLWMDGPLALIAGDAVRFEVLAEQFVEYVLSNLAGDDDLSAGHTPGSR